MQSDRRNFTIQLGAALRERRNAAEMTQMELALALGEPQSFVSRYETGERRLEFYDVHRICDVIGADFCGLHEELFG